MLKSLKIHINQSRCPVGIKKFSYIKLPSTDHVYGYKPKADLEGADKSKFINKSF